MLGVDDEGKVSVGGVIISIEEEDYNVVGLRGAL